MSALRPFAYLKNNQPYTCTLPFPMAGVLKPGERILTRYSSDRLIQILNGDGPSDVARELQVDQGPYNASETDFSEHSPGRDYFRGDVRTTDTTTTPISIVQAGYAAGSTGSFGLRLDQFQPGTYEADLTVKGFREGTTVGYGVYRRLVRFHIAPDGTATVTAVDTIGTDRESDAGLNATITTPGAPYVFVANAVGIAANFRWGVDININQINWAG